MDNETEVKLKEPIVVDQTAVRFIRMKHGFDLVAELIPVSRDADNNVTEYHLKHAILIEINLDEESLAQKIYMYPFMLNNVVKDVNFNVDAKDILAISEIQPIMMNNYIARVPVFFGEDLVDEDKPKKKSSNKKGDKVVALFSSGKDPEGSIH